MQVSRVNFFVAGVQKSATTTLCSFLADHPDLLRSFDQEIHFFDNEDLDWSAPDYSRLHARFPDTSEPRHPFDVTPIYIFWPPALERLRQYNPEARIILTFRDPIERAWSHWRMETARQTETLTFSEAIREGRTRLNQSDPLSPIWRTATYVERGFYAGQLEKALQHFPREQFLLLKTTDIATDHQAVLARIAGFFGISPFAATPARAERRGDTRFGQINAADTEYLRDLFADDTRRFAALSGLDLSDWPTLNKEIVIA